MEPHATQALLLNMQHQTDALKQIVQRLDRLNQLLYHMVPDSQREALKKEDTDRMAQMGHRPNT